MTIFFPDISSYTPVSLVGAPLVIARATIGVQTDSHWQSNVANAASHGVPLLAYCFLNAGSLGSSAEEQADYAASVVGRRPTMLDWEPNRGACATLGEACRWIDRFRSHGGVCNLVYLPRWTWGNPAGGNGLGSPKLDPLAQRGMKLVSSQYTSYSDAGAGWSPYYNGCPVPVVQWQFTSSHVFNGVAVDWNAFKGTVAQYLALAGGGGGETPIRGEAMLMMAHEAGSNVDWVGDGVFRYMCPDATHRKNILNVIAALGGDGSKSVEFVPGTLDALGPVVVDYALTGSSLTQVLTSIAANATADLAEDRATTAALNVLAQLINTGGGSIDVAPVIAAINDARTQVVQQVEARLAVAAQAQYSALTGATTQQGTGAA